LIDDEDARTRMGKIGRIRVEEKLAWSHSERAYVGVYAQLTGRPAVTGKPAVTRVGD
jgi:hypothetical protein